MYNKIRNISLAGPADWDLICILGNILVPNELGYLLPGIMNANIHRPGRHSIFFSSKFERGKKSSKRSEEGKEDFRADNWYLNPRYSGTC